MREPSPGSFPEGPLEPGGTAAASSELEKRLGVLCHLRMSPCQRLPVAKWKLLEILGSFSGVEYWATSGEGVPAGCPGVVAAHSSSVLQVGWPAPPGMGSARPHLCPGALWTPTREGQE